MFLPETFVLLLMFVMINWNVGVDGVDASPYTSAQNSSANQITFPLGFRKDSTTHRTGYKTGYL